LGRRASRMTSLSRAWER